MQLKQALPRPLRDFLWKRLYAVYNLPNRLRPPHEAIHILSHMRSGSTLLAHILATNPDIVGFGETMLPYRSSRDFDYARGRIRYALRLGFKPGSERYVLDKIVHNHLLEPTAVTLYRQRPAKLIFLLRQPKATLSSLMRQQKISDLAATTLLVQRLNHLTHLVQALPAQVPSTFLTYAQLIEKTEPVLTQLQAFLELEIPLSEAYTRLPTTGRLGGDRSPLIHTGTIVRNHQPPPIDITPESHAVAQNAYQACLDALATYSQPLLSF